MRRPLLFVCICLFTGIALWMQLKNPLPKVTEKVDWEGETVLFVGQIYKKEYCIRYGEEILILYLNSSFYSTEVKVSYLQIKQASQKLSDKIPMNNLICEISLEQVPAGWVEPRLGSEVFLKGKWQSISHATNPGEFDAANYYRIEGIGARLKNVELLGVSESHWRIREALYQLREHFLRNLYKGFPEETAAILAKMLLGVGTGLDKETRDLYQDNGIVHILSISGLHISLLGMGAYKLLRRLGCPMSMAAVAGGILILCYGMMTGFSVSACRAIGMYLVHMLGEIWGRTYDMLTAMGVLCVVLLADNPMLVYHSGFLLSFSSVCGVGLLSGFLQVPTEWFRKKPGEKRQRSLFKKLLQKSIGGFCVSLAVTLFSLPIQLFFFYKIPIYSVFMNLLVVPLMWLVMLIGLLVMIMPWLWFLSPIEAGLFGWFELLCLGFEKIPGHTLIVGRPAMWKILLYYVLLLLLILKGKKLQRVKQLGVLVGLVLFMVIRVHFQTKISMLDVGQGECICVQTGQGKCFLFDGGSSSRQNIGEKVMVPFLLYEGIDRIDAVFLSHGDIDHYSGILQLLEEKEISIGTLYLPKVGSNAMKDFAPILEVAENVSVQLVSKGDQWEIGALTLTCLHPYAGYEADSNAYSACYLLEKAGFCMLFTGDVEGQGEELLIGALEQKGIQNVDVLKVAHHGSRNATTDNFLQKLDVRLALISCGRDNVYGHPHVQTIERLEKEGCRILSTSEYGAITIDMQKKIQVYGFTG